MTVAITVAAYHAATMSPSALPSRLHLAFQGLRLRLRGSDLWFIALALLVGLIAGYLTLLQSGIARWLQGTLYGLDEGMRLSSLPSLTWTALLVLPLGGLLVGLVSLAAKVFRTLGDAGINIEMISTSPIKISCIIAAERVSDAVRGLHEAFELGAEAVHEEDPSGEHRPTVAS